MAVMSCLGTWISLNAYPHLFSSSSLPKGSTKVTNRDKKYLARYVREAGKGWTGREKAENKRGLDTRGSRRGMRA